MTENARNRLHGCEVILMGVLRTMGDNENKTTPAGGAATPSGDNLNDALSELKKDIENIGKLDWRGEKKPEPGK
jgi:hypothetical protein